MLRAKNHTLFINSISKCFVKYSGKMRKLPPGAPEFPNAVVEPTSENKSMLNGFSPK